MTWGFQAFAARRRSLRIHRKTGRSSWYTPNLRLLLPSGRGGASSALHGTLHVASSAARVRLRPAGWPSSVMTLGSNAPAAATSGRYPRNRRCPGHGCERGFTVVTEGRMPQIVGQARGIHDIRITPESLAQFAADLSGHFQGVGHGYGQSHRCSARPPGSWRPTDAVRNCAARAHGRARSGSGGGCGGFRPRTARRP